MKGKEKAHTKIFFGGQFKPDERRDREGVGQACASPVYAGTGQHPHFADPDINTNQQRCPSLSMDFLVKVNLS
jgi:hypothetical protein